MKKLSALMLALMLAFALFTGCGAAPADNAPAATPAPVESAAPAESTAPAEGTIAITFQVTDDKGETQEFPLSCADGAILGDVLLEAGLISQEEHDAGFVTVVNGLEANWDADQSWWALLDANGEMTPVGISDITLADGDVYSFVYTAGTAG